jgi:hypothetical protein
MDGAFGGCTKTEASNTVEQSCNYQLSEALAQAYAVRPFVTAARPCAAAGQKTSVHGRCALVTFYVVHNHVVPNNARGWQLLEVELRSRGMHACTLMFQGVVVCKAVENNATVCVWQLRAATRAGCLSE